MKATLSLPYQLDDCKVGEEKEITIKVNPTKNDDSGFEAEVVEVSGYDHEESESDMEEEPEASAVDEASAEADSEETMAPAVKTLYRK